MQEKNLIEMLAEQAPNRRSFLQKIGVASAALAAGTGAAHAQGTITDADILNFALNLEYLEAEFYTYATAGRGIETFGVGTSGTGTLGATTGGRQVTLSNSLVFTGQVAEQIAIDERAHVQLIRGALLAAGAQPIAKPAINLNALGLGFNGQLDFLTLARAFEDVGVSAYGGAAPLIQDKAILGTAARILATEALHTGNISTLR